MCVKEDHVKRLEALTPCKPNLKTHACTRTLSFTHTPSPSHTHPHPHTHTHTHTHTHRVTSLLILLYGVDRHNGHKYPATKWPLNIETKQSPFATLIRIHCDFLDEPVEILVYILNP